MSSGTETVEMTQPEVDKIRKWFVVEGTLRVILARRNAKLAVFAWLVERFEAGRRYPEASVNRMLADAHPDFATLRRGLYDEHFVDRSDSLCWRTSNDQRLKIRVGHEDSEQ
jgi:hypothetical protein